MKTQILKTLSAGCLLIGLAACSFNGDSTADQTKNYLDDRSRIMSTYQPVIGTYEGEIDAYIRSTEDINKFELKKIKLQLAIYTQDVQNGNDPNGQARPLPTLVIRYRQLDTVRPDELMNGARFVPESGELFATNSAASSGNGSNGGGSSNPSTGGGTSSGSGTYSSICNSGGSVATTLSSAHLSGNSITGTIFRGNGELGKFTVTRTTTMAIAPAVDPVTDCNDRLAVQYKTVSGTYVGKITHTAANGGTTMDVSLNLNYIPVAASNGTTAATLVGTFIYGAATVTGLAAVFRFDTTPAQLTMSYITSGNSSGGFSLTGTMDGDTYTAEAYSGNVGHLGTVVLKKAAPQL